MTAQTPDERDAPERGRLDLLGFIVRSVAPNELRMARPGSWVPLDFAGVLQRLQDAQPVEVRPA
jgi:hypothetical protein